MNAPTAARAHAPAPPGPSFWQSLAGYRRNPATYFTALAREYGDVLRWRGLMDIYLLNDPEDVRRVMTQAWPQFTKDNIDYRVLRITMGNGLVTNDGPDWARQRRLMQPMFHNRIVNAFDGAINACTEALVARWRARGADEAFALDRDLSRLTFQVVGATLFGADIDAHADEVAAMLDVMNVNPKTVRALLTQWPWLPTRGNREFARHLATLDRIVYGLIAARRAGGEERRDLLGLLLAARDADTGEAMAEQQVRDEVVTLMLAGHETSATALGWTFHLLAQHPEVEAALVDELARELGGRPAQAGDLARLPYLKQVVQESMRVYPPVWGLSRAMAADCEFGGYRIPRGAYVAILPYALHRHPAHWSDPERFDPSRFGPQRSESRHSYCYLPFAAGPRTCIGAGMAMLEIQLVLARLLPLFRVRPVPGHPVVPLASVTYRPRFGLRATVVPRV
ncbi:MAG: cytochrome P450 [Gammaproteobacteria bacterium]